MSNFRGQIECRSDIDRLNVPFVALHQSLLPKEEEKKRQQQLLDLLRKHVRKEWPPASLYLFGSAANSLGLRNCDLDICLTIDKGFPYVDKCAVLVKLAYILRAANFLNVEAITRAKVPIVKCTDPVTGISCDISVNNVLAVINTRLLRHYADIDSRLRQLAMIVKHWAKSRGINKTYKGTLSSYAYVIMCIHFLQQRKPVILPCLQVDLGDISNTWMLLHSLIHFVLYQGMRKTFVCNVENTECSYYDKVENLHGFGSRNMESIAQLIWAFFTYWAYYHDHANDVISVRTGSILSKREKGWAISTRFGRHHICIEDPFKTSHDLGGHVDEYKLGVLKREFERAAFIMRYHPDPAVALFQS